MEQVAPAGAVYQACTLSGNPVAMAAGLATLQVLREPGVYERLEDLGARMEQGLLAAAEAGAAEVTVNRVGAMLTMFFCGAPVESFDDAQRADTAAHARYWRHMLEHGVYLAPSQFEATMLSLAHTDDDLRRAREAAAAFFAAERSGGAAAHA
jgi:glutamate-1-semialdehyde 2,1-aminomutase